LPGKKVSIASIFGLALISSITSSLSTSSAISFMFSW